MCKVAREPECHGPRKGRKISKMEPRNSEDEANVLVVDDNETMREVLAIILSRKGYRCESATNGVEAMQKVMQGNFDAVVTDVDMPQMDGITLTRKLTQQFPSLPVMIITGQPHDNCMESAITAGAREFLRKPFEISEFVMRVQEMLRVSKVTREKQD